MSKIKKKNSMEIETRTENKNKKQKKNKFDSMSFIKCVPKAKKNKRKFMLFCPQMGSKNKTSFVQKRATNNLQLFTIRKHTQNSLVFLLTNKTTKSTKPTMTTQHFHNLTPSPSVHFHQKLYDKTKNHNKNKNKTSNNHLQQHHRTEIITFFDESYISYSLKPPDDIFKSNHQQKN